MYNDQIGPEKESEMNSILFPENWTLDLAHTVGTWGGEERGYAYCDGYIG